MHNTARNTPKSPAADSMCPAETTTQHNGIESFKDSLAPVMKILTKKFLSNGHSFHNNETHVARVSSKMLG